MPAGEAEGAGHDCEEDLLGGDVLAGGLCGGAECMVGGWLVLGCGEVVVRVWGARCFFGSWWTN